MDGGTYPDPTPGSDAELDAIPAFQSFLAGLPTTGDDDNPLVSFSTARTFPGKALFRQARTLDKIQYLVVSLDGDFGRSQVPTTLRYGGTGLIRTRVRPPEGGGERPDQQPGELTAYSTRVWRTNPLFVMIVNSQVVGLAPKRKVLADRDTRRKTSCVRSSAWSCRRRRLAR